MASPALPIQTDVGTPGMQSEQIAVEALSYIDDATDRDGPCQALLSQINRLNSAREGENPLQRIGGGLANI
jgi:hypothetical protein